MKIKTTSLITTFLTATLIATLFLGLAGIFLVQAEPNGAKVFVDPKDNIFPPPPLRKGDTFTVNVTIANMTGLAGFEFKLEWDSSLLNATDMVENLFATVTPPGEEGNIWPLTHSVGSGGVHYAYTYQNLTRAFGLGYAPINITTAEGYPEGKLAAAIITLEVIKEPTMAGVFVESNLEITVSKPGYAAPPLGPGGPIPHTKEHGYYKLSWSPPTVLPYFSVEPASYEATSLGEVFNVSVMINDLDAGWEAVGFEFKLGFNSSILEVLNVYEGPWLPPFGESPNNGTLFMSLIKPDHALVGDVVMPDSNGTWATPFPGTPIPGSGVLAIIEFNATYQGMFPEIASSILDLSKTKIGNWLAEPLNQTDPQDGVYSMRPKVLGPMIDIFTQYPDPYGGQGLYRPSDMFAPQGGVTLFAIVTYNEWPEQFKDVVFQIIDPNNMTWAVLYARTDTDGLASIGFTMPWPGEDLFGEWTVIGTVDIADESANDTLTFHYDFLVHIVKVTTDKTEYAHSEHMSITIEFKSKLMQSMNVTITVTAIDETGVAFGFMFIQTTIGGAEYCTYNDYTEGTSIHVEKYARAGRASIVVGALNDWLFNGGTAISGPFAPVIVAILAE